MKKKITLLAIASLFIVGSAWGQEVKKEGETKEVTPVRRACFVDKDGNGICDLFEDGTCLHGCLYGTGKGLMDGSGAAFGYRRGGRGLGRESGEFREGYAPGHGVFIERVEAKDGKVTYFRVVEDAEGKVIQRDQLEGAPGRDFYGRGGGRGGFAPGRGVGQGEFAPGRGVGQGRGGFAPGRGGGQGGFAPGRGGRGGYGPSRGGFAPAREGYGPARTPIREGSAPARTGYAPVGGDYTTTGNEYTPAGEYFTPGLENLGIGRDIILGQRDY